MHEKFFITRKELVYYLMGILFMSLFIPDVIFLTGLFSFFIYLYFKRKNKIFINDDLEIGYLAPIEGLVQALRIFDDRTRITFEVKPFGPFGIVMPDDAVLVDYKGQGKKKIFLEFEKNDGERFQLSILSNVFAPQIFVRTGDSGERGAFLGHLVGAGRVILDIKDRGDILIQSSQYIEAGQLVMKRKD